MVSEKIFQEEIAKLVFRAESEISEDVEKLLHKALEKETSPTAQSMLQSMVDDLKIAKEKQAAVCQSPGYPAIYIYFGDNNLPKGIKDMFTQPILDGTANGYLRPSIVHPLTRKNTGNNSGVNVPNFNFDYRAGQPYVDIYIGLKGCGAELGNAMKIMTVPMLGPGPKFNGLKRFILETAMNAGGKPCPPCAIGIGLGGQMDQCARLSREAITTRKWDDTNPDPMLADLEAELLESVNALGLGAAGCGGDTYCLALKIGMAYTHTAIAPVCINFHCWTARRGGIRIYDDGRIEKIL